jgi:hypothetical protein
MPNIRDLAHNAIDWLLDKPANTYTQEALAGSASALVNSIAYKQAHEHIVRRVFAEWLATKPEEFQRREQLYQEILALGKVQTELNLFVFNQEKAQDNA